MRSFSSVCLEARCQCGLFEFSGTLWCGGWSDSVKYLLCCRRGRGPPGDRSEGCLLVDLSACRSLGSRLGYALWMGRPESVEFVRPLKARGLG